MASRPAWDQASTMKVTSRVTRYSAIFPLVTLIFWSFCSGMLLLGGAYLSAAEHSIRKQARRATVAGS